MSNDNMRTAPSGIMPQPGMTAEQRKQMAEIQQKQMKEMFINQVAVSVLPSVISENVAEGVTSSPQSIAGRAYDIAKAVAVEAEKMSKEL